MCVYVYAWITMEEYIHTAMLSESRKVGSKGMGNGTYVG